MKFVRARLAYGVALALAAGMPTASFGQKRFVILLDNTGLFVKQPGRVTAPYVGVGTFISPIDLAPGKYALSALGGFAVNVALSGGPTFTNADISTPLNQVAVGVTSYAPGGERLVFTENGSPADGGAFGGSLDFTRGFSGLTFEPSYAGGNDYYFSSNPNFAGRYLVLTPNTVLIEQVGDQNAATASQTGSLAGNIGTIYQAKNAYYTTGLTAIGNTATVRQEGASTIGNYSMVVQQGQANNASATMTGAFNSSGITQLGNVNHASATVGGDSNYSRIVQGASLTYGYGAVGDPGCSARGACGLTYVPGSNNNSATVTFGAGARGSASNIFQTAADNLALVDIRGINQTSDIRQSDGGLANGGNNSAEVDFGALASNASNTISQAGTSNRATLTVTTAGAIASVTQTGIANVATLTQ